MPELERTDRVLEATDPSVLLARIDARLLSIAQSIARVADHLAPPPPEAVGTRYVAERLGCTTTWVADLARRGGIPADCVAPSAGVRGQWRFYRSRIDLWLESR